MTGQSNAALSCSCPTDLVAAMAAGVTAAAVGVVVASRTRRR